MTPIPVVKTQVEYAHQDYRIQACYQGRKITHIRIGNSEAIAVAITHEKVVSKWKQLINYFNKSRGYQDEFIKIQINNSKTGASVVSVRVKDLAKILVSSLSNDEEFAKSVRSGSKSKTEFATAQMIAMCSSSTKHPLSTQNVYAIANITYKMLKAEKHPSTILSQPHDYIVIPTNGSTIPFGIAKVTQQSLGEGTFGKVVRVISLDDEVAPLALKTVNVASKEQADELKSLRKECEIMQLLNADGPIDGIPASPHFVTTLYDTHGVLMPKFDHDLDNLPKTIPIEHVVQGFGQLCVGLEHMHKQGIFHHDIKPANLSYTANANVGLWRLADFGAAERLKNKDDFMSVFACTPSYTMQQQYKDVRIAKRKITDQQNNEPLEKVLATRDHKQLKEALAIHDNLGLALSFLEVALQMNKGELCILDNLGYIIDLKFSDDKMREDMDGRNCPRAVTDAALALLHHSTDANLTKFKEAIARAYPHTSN